MPCYRNEKECDRLWKQAKKHEEKMQAIIDNVEPKDQPFTKFDRNIPVSQLLKPTTVCKYCTRDFSSPQACKRHEEHCNKSNDSELAWKCSECGKGFKTKEGLASHQSKHQEFQCYVCSDCSKVYQSLSELRKHCSLFSHAFPPVEGPVLEDEKRCEVCFKVYKKHSMEYHMEEHQQKSNKVYKCEKCDYFTIRKNNLSRHLEVKHNTWNIDFDLIKKHFANPDDCKHGYKCPKCKKICKSYEETVAHLKLKKCGEENICKICDIKFTMKQSLKTHMKRKHPIPN